MRSNSLTGPLPPWLGSLCCLQELRCADNTFSGSIPPTLGALGGLRALDVEKNRLEGVIPDIFEGMSGIKLLYLGPSPRLVPRAPRASHLLSPGESRILQIQSPIFAHAWLPPNHLFPGMAHTTFSHSPARIHPAALHSPGNNRFIGRIPSSVGVLEKALPEGAVTWAGNSNLDSDVPLPSSAAPLKRPKQAKGANGSTNATTARHGGEELHAMLEFHWQYLLYGTAMGAAFVGAIFCMVDPFPKSP